MCGIVGYIGNRPAQSVLFDCLSRLEYRGYDSSGIAVRGSGIRVQKDKVRVEALREESIPFHGMTGIGHTRWATHGVPSLTNAHPHTDCTGAFAVVHNGVITNYLKLKNQLISEGHTFISETDTEVIPHLIEKCYRGDLKKAVEAAIEFLEGSYAIAVLTSYENRIVVARKDSPLIIGVGDGENFIASDVPALLEYTNRFVYLENGNIGVIAPDSLKISRNGTELEPRVERVLWDKEAVCKSGYEHFMLKEIHEQPRVIRNNLASPLTSDMGLTKGLQSLLILACGTSYHAGLISKYVLEELLGATVVVELASEFNCRSRIPNVSKAILITQSGETADVLLAMKRLRDAGISMFAITNVPNSTASRLADSVIYTNAGPEVSVAATKSFTAQLMAIYRLALSVPTLEQPTYNLLDKELRQLPIKVQEIIEHDGEIINCAKYLSNYNNVFFIGRGINFPVALEGALKLKEISYIHAEGYAAGELKHGPLALLNEDTPVIAAVSHDRTYETMLTNIKEVKARGAPVIVVSDEYDHVSELSHSVIKVSSTANIFSPVVNTVALQLLAYYTARNRNCPIDFPRNLAKSVTVE